VLNTQNLYIKTINTLTAKPKIKTKMNNIKINTLLHEIFKKYKNKINNTFKAKT